MIRGIHGSTILRRFSCFFVSFVDPLQIAPTPSGNAPDGWVLDTGIMRPRFSPGFSPSPSYARLRRSRPQSTTRMERTVAEGGLVGGVDRPGAGHCRLHPVRLRLEHRLDRRRAQKMGDVRPVGRGFFGEDSALPRAAWFVSGRLRDGRRGPRAQAPAVHPVLSFHLHSLSPPSTSGEHGKKRASTPWSHRCWRWCSAC